MLTGVFNGQRFHLLAAHLQGEPRPEYSEESQRVRDRQLAQIRDELLEVHAGRDVPLTSDSDSHSRRA